MSLEYSVVIQGPLNEVSLQNLDHYRDISGNNVVISYWEGNDESLLDKYSARDCLLVKKPAPPRSILSHVTNHDTFVYQLYSIYFGLSAVQTPYAIRSRSDERYHLTALIEKFDKNKDKVVCGNILFKKWGHYQFHMGDHLFIGKTPTLLSAYSRIINENQNYGGINCPEHLVAVAILDVLGLERNRENFTKAFDVIDSNLLRPFIGQYRHAGITYNNDFNDDATIKTMDQL